LNCGFSGSSPKPKLGEPPIEWPSSSTSWTRSIVPPKSRIAPDASSTSGSACTLGRSDTGTVASPLVEPLTSSRPEMTTLVFV
jgi:hypothetical protein